VDQSSKEPAVFGTRIAVEADAAQIISILEGIAAEGTFTAISRPWSIEHQRKFLVSLSEREAIHVAETERDGIIGYQVLERWAPTLDSMSHVGQIGTFLKSEWRRRGVGEALFRTTLDFARQHGFLKFVIQVRASNAGALAFYKQMGFREIGRFARQVRIGEIEDDEVLLEFFLPAD
jgi:ribosomal protein S18 acetylase RimI-like enzyme